MGDSNNNNNNNSADMESASNGAPRTASTPTSSSMAMSKDPDAIKLFIGQVPKTYNEGELQAILEPFGPIFELIVLRDKANQTHKGCAFVTFCHRSSAERAIAELHKHPLPDSTNILQVKPAEGDGNRDSKLFIGMLSKAVQEDDLRTMFAPFGAVEEISVLRNSDGTSKGCAFVKYSLRQEAQNAIDALDGKFTVEGAANPIVVKFADNEKQRAQRKMQHQMSILQNYPIMAANMLAQQPAYMQQTGFAFPPGTTAASSQFPQFYQLQQPSQTSGPSSGADMAAFALQQQYAAAAAATANLGGVGFNPMLFSPTAAAAAAASGARVPVLPQKEGPDGANLFIYHLPANFMDGDLLATFAPFGNVISAKVFIDKMTGQSKCFGFISYDNPASGAAAIQNMNGFYVGGKRLKVQLKQRKTPY